MRPNDLELVRVGHGGRRTAFAVCAAALLLVIAVLKPWPGSPGATPSAFEPPRQLVAGITAGPPVAAASPTDAAAAMCQNPDGWRIVADDVELGRRVRTWIVAAVEYSTVPPVRSTVPVTPLVSSGVSSLGFCLSPESVVAGETGWSGTLWRQSGAGDPNTWQAAAQLTPAKGSIGALANRTDGSEATWPPGRYLLEARFDGSSREAWLGLVIRTAA